MVGLKSILMLLPCTLYVPTLAAPALVPDGLTLSSTTLDGSNFTQIFAIEKRMDSQPSVPTQSSAQNTNPFEQAKRRGAKYLELLLANEGERVQMAALHGEPVRPPVRPTTISNSVPGSSWQHIEASVYIPVITRGNEPVLRATCPTGAYVSYAQGIQPISAAAYLSTALQRRWTGSVYDVISGGLLRVTNTRTPNMAGNFPPPFVHVQEGPLNDPQGWPTLECSTRQAKQ